MIPKSILGKIPHDIITILKTIEHHGFQGFIVGGALRDMLLSRVPMEYDVATNAHPTDMMRMFDVVHPTGMAYGTVTVVSNHRSVEITTFRQDGTYQNQRHPNQVVFSSSIDEDMARRDFTMNAMAYNPLTEQWVDPYHGQDHLHQRLLACVGHPMDRFSEDMLRPFRCFRFMSQLGLSLSPTIQQALRHLNQPISLPSMERIRHEMDRLLLGPFWQSALHAMHQYGWLQHITTSPPDLQHVPELPNDALYRWAWLLSTHHLANASSLCFSKKDMRTMQRMIDWNFDDYAVSLTQHDLAISSDTLKALGYHGRNLGMIQRTILHALRTRSIPNTLDAIHGFLSNQSPPQN